MTDQPDPAVPDPAVPDPAAPDPAVPDPAVPDPVELERIAVPGTVRRVPQYRAFAMTGIAVGLLVAVVVLLVSAATQDVPASLLLVLATLVGLGGLGALLGLLVALGLEARARR
ncbi:hypothetical protein OEB99_13260 [Actinotalea sp. M2MS4P-6]|uniref:hypothetical protein n=1 Tax=Actinotalea sp. M2MS4P-6 TaxID=2983762 RepID=UPI0021E3F135|nr:hypothetical protein [Actinotalea sp. M2MS4P-6]MCV2395278.1 hypothetical protein [Actinotalea sp. M2MS4P-6]